MVKKDIFVYIAPSLAFFDNVIPLIYELKRLNYKVTAILRDQKMLSLLTQDRTYLSMTKLFDQIIYKPNKYMHSSLKLPHKVFFKYTLLRFTYYIILYIKLKLFRNQLGELYFTKNPIFCLERLCGEFNKDKSILLADITFLQNPDSISIDKLKGSRVISIPHGIEFSNKDTNQEMHFGESEIIELYFSDTNYYESKAKNIRLVNIPRHNFAWRDTYQNNYASIKNFTVNDIVVFSDPDRRFSPGEKTKLFYEIFITANNLGKNVFITPHPKEFSSESIREAAKQAHFKNWRLNKFSPLSLGNKVFAAITFGSSTDWDLAFYEIPAIIFKRNISKNVENYRNKNFFTVVHNLAELENVLSQMSNAGFRELAIQNAKKEYMSKFIGEEKSDITKITPALFS